MKKHFPINDILSFFIQLFTVAALLALAGSAAGYLLPDNSSELSDKYTPLFIELLRPLIKPEPVEKTIYIILCLLLVPAAAAILWLFSGKFQPLNNKSRQASLWAVCALTFILIIWCFFGKMDFFETVFKSITDQPYYWLPCAILAAAAAITCIKLKFNPAGGRKWWMLAVFPLIITVIFNRTYYLGWVPPNSYHLEILIYAVSHAAKGQLEYHLYGNYHWMLAPLFAVIKPSIFNFSIVMNTLFVAVFMIIAFTGSRLIKNYILLLLMFSFLLLMVCWFTIHQHFVDPYFQYHPIRSFWPAVSLLIFYFYHKSGGRLRYNSLAAVCCAVSLFWNIDSGIAVTGAFVFLFAAETVTANRFKAPASFCIVFAAALLLLYAIYCWSAGEILSPGYFLQGHQMFLQTGFYALPMPHKICMWVFFAGIYVTAVIAGLRGMFLNRKTLFSQSCIFLGILGIGLFSYYQNRSHIYVLTAPTWPAVLLMFMFADRCLRLAGTSRNLRALLLPALPIIMLGIGAIFIFACNSKFILNGTIMQMSFITVSDNESQYQQRINFIRQCAGTRRQVNIIGGGQGIYYAESGLAAGIKNFNRAEIYTIADDKYVTGMLKKSDCPLFVTPGDGIFYELNPEVLKYYKLIATSEDNEIKYYEPLKNIKAK